MALLCLVLCRWEVQVLSSGIKAPWIELGWPNGGAQNFSIIQYKFYSFNIDHRYDMAWLGRDLKYDLFPFSLPWVGTPSKSHNCSEPPASLVWTLPWMGHPEVHLYQDLTTLMVRDFILISNLNLPSFNSEMFSLILSPHIYVGMTVIFEIFLH